jgi:hypothetical protein
VRGHHVALGERPRRFRIGAERGSSGGAPDLGQRSVLSVDRVAIGYRYGGDVGKNLVPLGWVAAP